MNTDEMSGYDGYLIGDLIFIDPEAQIIAGSDVLIHQNRGAPILRRIFLEDNVKYVCGINPKYKLEKIPLTEIQQIIGKVIYSGRAR